MKKGEKITHEQLKELGYKHYFNIGRWEIWAKHSSLHRVYVDMDTREIKQMYNCGQSVEEL